MSKRHELLKIMISFLSNLEKHCNICASIQQFWAGGWITRSVPLLLPVTSLVLQVCCLHNDCQFLHCFSLWSLPLSWSYFPQFGSLTFSHMSVPSSKSCCSLRWYHTITSFIFPVFLSAHADMLMHYRNVFL